MHEAPVADADRYRSASPFPHIVIDGMFSPELVRTAALQPIIPSEKSCYASFGKARLSDVYRMNPAARQLVERISARPFIAWLEKLTGIPDLAPDPELAGGGLHRIERGGFLKIHADFSWNRRLQLYRRVNVLLYLNEVWREEWGGHLELWPADMSKAEVKIAPTLGRLVVFSTGATSFHGHPEPLSCPAQISRDSLAAYYYSAEPPRDTPRTTMTDFRPRPAEQFHGLRRLVHKAKLAAHV